MPLGCQLSVRFYDLLLSGVSGWIKFRLLISLLSVHVPHSSIYSFILNTGKVIKGIKRITGSYLTFLR